MNESQERCMPSQTALLSAGAGAAIQPSRESKHIALYKAISEIETVKYYMLDILDTIRGPMPQTAVDPSSKNPEEPSLSSVLRDGPEDILKKCQAMHSILDEIKGELF